MLNRILTIALLHIKLVLSNRSVFFFSLVAPIIFTALMGQANLSGFGNDTSDNQRINVVNEDTGQLGQGLIKLLGSVPGWKVEVCNRETATIQLKHSAAIATLLIPADFSQSSFKGQPAALEFVTTAGGRGKAQQAEPAVRAAVMRLSEMVATAVDSTRVAERLGLFAGSSKAGAISDQQRSYFQSALARAGERWTTTLPFTVREESAAGSTDTATGLRGGTEQSSPGVMVIFALLFAVSGTNILIWERQAGTLRRLLVMPMSKNNILFGKLLGIYLIGIVQMVLIILAGRYLFSVQWGRSPVALSLMVLSFALVATSLGILLATLVRTIAQADALASMVVMAISALGGAWWPLDAGPRWMSIFGHAFPTAWAMDGFRNIIIRGQDVLAVLPQIVVLLCFATLFLTIGLWRFRYE